MGSPQVYVFLANAPSHPETLQNPLEFIKLACLLKNTTSKLQPADAGIIRNLKAKYVKRLFRHAVSIINGENIASNIIKQVTVLNVTRWLKTSWDEVNKSTIRNCFKKCGERD